MQYVPFGNHGFDVSRLGFGCMRLPVRKEEEKEVIDRPAAIKLIREGIDGGITYVDTAYGYHNGESEIVVGQALKDGYREKVKLTTKLPPWVLNEEKDMNRVLDEQLKKLDVPYVDFYILHALNKDSFAKLQSFHYQDFIHQALKDGRIKHTGFSFHDDKETFVKILHDFEGWGLAQIQYNYLDDQMQATEEGLKLAGKMGIPIVIMEPLRGGALANPPANVAEKIAAYEKKRSAVEWAFAYVANYAEVATILSGMSNEEQLRDNLRIFDTLTVGGMTEKDQALVKSLKEAYLSRMPVKCTGCEYCIPCPQEVRIPKIFAAYNDSKKFDRPASFIRSYAKFIENGHDAAQCVQCGHCESVCPQQLPIMDWLQKIDQEYHSQK
ncbi:MAG: aldo/keto reductase [Clostridiales bacterium]|nr:aldo/keto reductase [Clostridiales bacterium]